MDNVDKIVGYVYETDDYGKFGFFDENREVIKSHVKQMVESIKNGNANPKKWTIIVDEETMNIVEGQNRFTACKETGSKFRYIFAHSFELDDIAIMNSKNRNWVPKDFINYYAAIGKDDYIRLKKLIEWSPFSAYVTILVAVGTRCSDRVTCNKSKSASLRSGDLTFSSRDYIESVDAIKTMGLVDKRILNGAGTSFKEAMAIVIRYKLADNKRLVKVINNNMSTIFENKKKLKSISACLEYMTEFYNRNLRSESNKVDLNKEYQHKVNEERGNAYKVVCLTTGKTFMSMSDASKSLCHGDGYMSNFIGEKNIPKNKPFELLGKTWQIVMDGD